jgi:thioesterase domain-containing protein
MTGGDAGISQLERHPRFVETRALDRASRCVDPSESSTSVTALAALGHELSTIPLTRAMGVAVETYDGDSLTLSAPLAPNVNDKGCAFGGSLVSLMTLAGWGLVKLALDRQGRDCDIYVQDSDVRYLAPVWNDFSAIARLVDRESFTAMIEALGARGRARTRVRCVVPLPDGTAAATLEARFVAILRR